MCILITSWFCESVDETVVDVDSEDGDNACEIVTESNGDATVEADWENDGLVSDDADVADDGEDFAPTFTGKRLLLEAWCEGLGRAAGSL